LFNRQVLFWIIILIITISIISGILIGIPALIKILPEYSNINYFLNSELGLRIIPFTGSLIVGLLGVFWYSRIKYFLDWLENIFIRPVNDLKIWYNKKNILIEFKGAKDEFVINKVRIDNIKNGKVISYTLKERVEIGQSHNTNIPLSNLTGGDKKDNLKESENNSNNKPHNLLNGKNYISISITRYFKSRIFNHKLKKEFTVDDENKDDQIAGENAEIETFRKFPKGENQKREFDITKTKKFSSLFSSNNDTEKEDAGNRQPRIIILLGKPGSGKTLLGLELFADMCKINKKKCLYLSSDQKLKDLQDYCDSFNIGNIIEEDNFTGFDQKQLSELEDLAILQKYDLVSRIKKKKKEKNKEEIANHNIINKIKSKEYFIFDAFNVSKINDQTRFGLESFFDNFRNAGKTGIFLIEDYPNIVSDTLKKLIYDSEFLADMVIELKEDDGEHLNKYLKIKKMRYRSHPLGWQLYKIAKKNHSVSNLVNDQGIVIFPSLHKNLSKSRKDTFSNDRESYKTTGIPALDEKLSPPKEGDEPVELAIPSNSNITIRGRRGGYKLSLGLSILLANWEKSQAGAENKNVLVITLGEEFNIRIKDITLHKKIKWKNHKSEFEYCEELGYLMDVMDECGILRRYTNGPNVEYEALSVDEEDKCWENLKEVLDPINNTEKVWETLLLKKKCLKNEAKIDEFIKRNIPHFKEFNEFTELKVKLDGKNDYEYQWKTAIEFLKKYGNDLVREKLLRCLNIQINSLIQSNGGLHNGEIPIKLIKAIEHKYYPEGYCNRDGCEKKFRQLIYPGNNENQKVILNQWCASLGQNDEGVICNQKINQKCARIVVANFRPGHITPEEFIRCVDELLKKGNFGRVLFHSTALIPMRFPALIKEPLFISTLADLFKANNVISIFIDPQESLHESPSLNADISYTLGYSADYLLELRAEGGEKTSIYDKGDVADNQWHSGSESIIEVRNARGRVIQLNRLKALYVGEDNEIFKVEK